MVLKTGAGGAAVGGAQEEQEVQADNVGDACGNPLHIACMHAAARKS